MRHAKNPTYRLSMGEVKEEVNNAIDTLGLKDTDILLLEDKEGRELYFDLLKTFVKSGDRRWWWEDFKHESSSIDHFEHPLIHLENFIPDLDNHVWFMVEDDQEDYYPIYDCSPKVIGNILNECFGFEYYIISKDKKWLICENHHSRLIGLGNLPNFANT